MRILHVYSQSDTALAHYVSIVTAALGNDVECKSADSAETTAELCSAWQPDIVHIHGTLEWTVPANVRVVLSPHGSAVSRKAYVIIARSPIEQRLLRDNGHRRIEVIRNPIITKTISSLTMARQLMEVYRRVMDSNVRELMDRPTKDMLHTLLKAGITNDRRWVEGRELHTDINWRQLFIYTQAEGILPILQNGIEVLRMDAPKTDISTIKTYLPDNYHTAEADVPSGIPALLATIDKHVRQQQLPLNLIAALHRQCMLPELDEGQLMGELDSKQRQLLARLMQVAHEETLLDEGYMPTMPIDDRGTQQIRLLISNHQKI